MNRQGGIYDNGRVLPQMYRERILDLYHQGTSQRAIADDMRVSMGYVNKVVHHYVENNTSLPQFRKHAPRNIITPEVSEYIEMEKLCQPSIYSAEIKNRLLLDGVSLPGNVPSEAAICKCVRDDCFMTRKKITQVPTETLSQTVIDYTNHFLNETSQLNPTKIHFFDESSVIMTTGNRLYGHSYKGDCAVEFQRYASNANYTINLLHSMFGVGYCNILKGPSNGMEMLNFLDEALSVYRPDGSAVIEHGDTIVMDNCRFHHGLFVEPLVRDILQDCGVQLLFQPPYSPHLNPCENCFHQVKSYLKRNPTLTANETEIAIREGISTITVQNSFSYFRHCGYID